MKMRSLVICFILISFVAESYSQTLNKLGKIEVDELPQAAEYSIRKIDGAYKIFKGKQVFEGNTFFQLPNGFLTALVVVDDEKDWIKHYSKEGQLLSTILTDRLVNLKVSQNGLKAVFYNKDSIYAINLETYNIDTLRASFVYEFLSNNRLIYYIKETKSVSFDGNINPIDEFPNQFIEYKGRVLAISKKNIYELSPSGFQSIYKFKGIFYDLKINHDDFYFVDKTEKRKKESFSLYKTSDFSEITLIDRIDELNR